MFQKPNPGLRVFILFCLLFGVIEQSISQEKKERNLNNYIVAGWEYPFFRTYSLGYQRMISHKEFIKVGFTIQPISKHRSYESKDFLFTISNYNKARVFTARSVSIGYGQYIIPKIGFYIAGEFLYRDKFFENKYYYQCAGTSRDSQVSLRSEYYNEFEIRGLAGFRIIIAKWSNVRFVADFNVGAGLNISSQKHLLIAERYGTCSSNDLLYFPTPQESKVVKLLPAVVLRARVGIVF